MKRSYVKAAVGALMAACLFTGCSGSKKEAKSPAESAISVTATAVPSPTLTATPVPTATSTPVPTPTEAVDRTRGHYEFKTYVMPTIFADIMGEDMCEAYRSYVDAVLAGENSFKVKSDNDYGWMLGQFPDRLYPIFDVYVESDYGGGYNNGTGTFHCNIPKEELFKKEAEFETLVTDILNENLRDDYSDFEKVLALYIYFYDNCTYDYDEVELTPLEMYGSPYRVLTEKTGICGELSTAFSYLLLQAGVDSTTCGGYSHNVGDAHGWSYITINGRNYHVDPTFAMSNPGSMAYLMMNDSQREIEGGFVKSEMCVGCHYKDEHNGDKYDANDDFFAPLWSGTLISWDHDKKLIRYYDMDGNEATFDYSAVG